MVSRARSEKASGGARRSQTAQKDGSPREQPSMVVIIVVVAKVLLDNK